MGDYDFLGLNSKLQATTSPITTQTYTPAYDFGSSYEVQSNRLITSKIIVENFIKRTGFSSATASFATNQTLNITTTASFKDPNRFKAMFGIPYVSIWEGTVMAGTTEIYPIKGTAVAGTYTVTSGFDYQAWAGTPSLVYRTQITRNAGTSSQVFTYGVDVVHIDYVAGTAN
jgi:hypothetical protein